MTEPHPSPTCPVCHSDDRVSLVSELAEKDEALSLRLPPPEAPGIPRPLVGMNEGLGCLGALFFGSAFFLSLSFGATVGIVIFGVFLLFFLATFLLTIWRGIIARRKLDQLIPAWQARMQTWERLYYCKRDDLVFDPQSGLQAAVDQFEDLFTDFKTDSQNT